MRLRALALLVTAMVVLGLQSPATASTGGTADTTNAYPSVGLIVGYADGERFRCTATLIRSDLLLTAAHCTDGVVGKMLVTFDAHIADKAPAPLPVAKDPSAGYTTQEITKAGYLAGTAYTHPEYSGFTDMDNWNDVGVVVMDRAVRGIAPASIASVGTLDAIPTAQLSSTLFTAVGYGTEVRKAESGPQKPEPMSYPLIRRYVDMPGQKLTAQILQTNGNEKDPRGTGGTCFGDSGGPLFLNGEIVAVTSYGLTDNCRYIGGNQRVDISVVQDWLAGAPFYYVAR